MYVSVDSYKPQIKNMNKNKYLHKKCIENKGDDAEKLAKTYWELFLLFPY